MSTDTTVDQSTRVEQRICNLEDQKALVVEDLLNEKKRLAAVRRAVRLLHLVLQVRGAADRLPLPDVAIVMLAPAMLMGVVFILFDVATGSRTLSAIGACSVGIAAVFFLREALLRKSHEQLSRRLSDARREISELLPNVARIEDVLREIKLELGDARAELQQCNATLEQQRLAAAKAEPLARLYARNWRAMRDIPFENYLEEVCIALGYSVETTNVSGDQGVDLVVTRGVLRMAIQVKGYHNSVGNAAVQQAFAGMAFYECDACAVITNSRFTTGAIELAESTNCLLIHEDNFREFVMGRLPLFGDVQCGPSVSGD